MRRSVTVTAVLQIYASIMISAQGSGEWDGKPITAIQFSDPQPLHQSDLDRVVTLRVGQPLHAKDVANAIDSLFSTGRFTDIAVEANPTRDGVVVRFITQNLFFLGGFSVESKIIDSPSRGEATSAVQLRLGNEFREEDVRAAEQNLERLLQANGLYESMTTTNVQRDERSQRVFITFVIKAGKRARYQSPEIEGDHSLSEATILKVTGWRVPLIHWWRHVTDARTQSGLTRVQRKYQSRDFLMAHVDLTKLDYFAERRRVQPHLSIMPGPKVEVRALEAAVSKKILKRYVPVFQELAVDEDLLVEGQRNLRDYLQGQGYYDVDVTFRMQPLKNDTLTVEYVISRGQRYKLSHLSITGNRYFDITTLRERMFIEPASFRMRRGRYSEAFRRKDEENITNLYKNNGFLEASVAASVDRTYQGKPGNVEVTLQIQEGEQFLVDALTIEGTERNFAPELSTGVGQPFSETTLAADREYLLNRLSEEGFLNASVDAAWTPSSEPHRMNVKFIINEGTQQFVRDVIVSGLGSTRPNLVRQYFTLKPGDPLSVVAKSATQQQLYNLGVFSRVDSAIENPDGDTRYKSLLYHFDAANRYTFSFGIGAQVGRFGTPNSSNLSTPGGSTGFSPQVSFTVARMNFLGRGHTVTLRTNYSTLQQRASIAYLQPRFRNREGRNITYSLLYDKSLDVRTFQSQRKEASIQISQQFTKAVTGLFQIAYRQVSVDNVVIPVLLVPQLVQPVRIGIVSGNFVQDRRDNAGDAHRGIYNTADFGLATRVLASQRNFGRILFRNATYHPLTRNVVFARQTQFGAILPFATPQGTSEQQAIPLPERFFGGGADSLRAFPYNQAGPRDTGTSTIPGGQASSPTGFPLGGNALFFNTVELRAPLIGNNIQAVLFHDMGNVYSSLGNISLRFRQRNNQDFAYAAHAVGFGIRYRTPIGPIRGDIAYSINPPSFVGFQGTPTELLQCNPNRPQSSLPAACQGVPQRLSHFQFFFSIGQTF